MKNTKLLIEMLAFVFVAFLSSTALAECPEAYQLDSATNECAPHFEFCHEQNKIWTEGGVCVECTGAYEFDSETTANECAPNFEYCYEQEKYWLDGNCLECPELSKFDTAVNDCVSDPVAICHKEGKIAVNGACVECPEAYQLDSAANECAPHFEFCHEQNKIWAEGGVCVECTGAYEFDPGATVNACAPNFEYCYEQEKYWLDGNCLECPELSKFDTAVNDCVSDPVAICHNEGKIVVNDECVECPELFKFDAAVNDCVSDPVAICHKEGKIAVNGACVECSEAYHLDSAANECAPHFEYCHEQNKIWAEGGACVECTGAYEFDSETTANECAPNFEYCHEQEKYWSDGNCVECPELSNLNSAANECVPALLLGQCALLVAVRNNDVARVRALLNPPDSEASAPSAEVDINCVDDQEVTPLIAAAQQNRKDIVDLLLAASPGPDLNRPSFEGRNAMMWAAQNGNLDMVNALWDAGADPDRKNHVNQRVPIQYAGAYAGGADDYTLPFAMIRRGAVPAYHKHTTRWALKNNEEALARRIMYLGSFLANGSINIGYKGKKSLLFWAAEEGEYIFPAQAALADGAKCGDDFLSDGQTAAGVAHENGHRFVRAVILNEERCADPVCPAGEQWDSEGRECSEYCSVLEAVRDDNIESVRTLLATRATLSVAADIDCADEEDGDTALIAAARLDKTEIGKLLLTASAPYANANKGNTEERTALMWAVENANSDLVEALITAGANVDATETDGTRVADYATNQDVHADVGHKLALAGVKLPDVTETLRAAIDLNLSSDLIGRLVVAKHVNISSGGEPTLLIYAARNGHTALAAALITNKADITVLDAQNRERAFRVAVRGGHFDTAKAIKEGADGVPFNTLQYALETGDTALRDAASAAATADFPYMEKTTALFYAAGALNLTLAQALVDDGASKEIKNTAGIIPLHAAMQADAPVDGGLVALLKPKPNTPVNTVQYAIQSTNITLRDAATAAADANFSYSEGFLSKAVIFHATWHKNLTLVNALIADGVNGKVFLDSFIDSTPLEIAIVTSSSPDIDIIRALIPISDIYGESPDSDYGSWGSPLGYASRALRSNEIISLLIDNGADPNRIDGLGYTALAFIGRNHHHSWSPAADSERVAALLVRRGANPNIGGYKSGWSSNIGNHFAIRGFLSAGADCSLANTSYYGTHTPLGAVIARKASDNRIGLHDRDDLHDAAIAVFREYNCPESAGVGGASGASE